MTSLPRSPVSCQGFALLASALDRRSAARRVRLLLGAVLARGRRTVTAWIRAAGLSDQFQPCYTAVAAAGKKADTIAAYLLLWVVKPLVSGAERLTLVIDDTPTPRYGPHVQGAGVHHNPTPGPAGSPYVHGHVFVVLGLLAVHPTWGTIALPLPARLYVRADVGERPKVNMTGCALDCWMAQREVDTLTNRARRRAFQQERQGKNRWCSRRRQTRGDQICFASWRLAGWRLCGLLLTSSSAPADVVVTLGNQDFADGSFVAGVVPFDAASIGEPSPFNAFRGSDVDDRQPFTASWTFSYAALTATGATITLGIFDHDSAASGDQVASFTLDGNDMTALLNTAFNASGGTQLETNVYTLSIPAGFLASLNDGSATFSLTLQGLGLGGVAGTTDAPLPGNGAGADFSTLSITTGLAAVPEPATFGLAALGAGAFALLQWRRRHGG